MCGRVTCSKCGKPTWAGCGMHIESALAGVKPEDRCKCDRGGNTKASQNPSILNMFIPQRK
eukprot:gene5519-5929_t